MKILVTGFEPFGGEHLNPAWEAVSRMPDEIAGAHVLRLQVPTVFDRAGDVLTAAMDMELPDIVICVGQAGGRGMITPERVAINLQDAASPDNAGLRPEEKPIDPNGPAAYFANLPLKQIVKAVNEAGIPSAVSNTAGTFVCNDLMYRLLKYIHSSPRKIRGGFIHVPYETDQLEGKPAGTPAMPLAQIIRGLETAVKTAVQYF